MTTGSTTRTTRGEALPDVDGREARLLGEGPVTGPGQPSRVASAGSVRRTDGGEVSDGDRARVVDLLVRLRAEKGDVVDVEP